MDNSSMFKKSIAVIVFGLVVINPVWAVDVTAPVLAQLTPVKERTNNVTPGYTFSSTEAGTIIYSGSCVSATTVASAGNNTITFNALAEGAYRQCKLSVKDAAGNVSIPLSISPFIIDTTPPVITQVNAIPASTADATPDYVFNTNEFGRVIYAGICASDTAAVFKGNNTLTLRTLSPGIYSHCGIALRDAAGNMSPVLMFPAFTVQGTTIATAPLNDTGVVRCSDYAFPYSGKPDGLLDCAATGVGTAVEGIDADGDPVPAGQDALYGRDANPATNSNIDGVGGFSFTKLDANGNALAIQNGVWSDSGNEAAGTQWSCVLDNVTGLIWEVKTNDGGLRDKDWRYTWYNPDSSQNGGDAGVGDTGVGTSNTGHDSGSDFCFTPSRCDTQKYIEDVNTTNLCGETANDWRLPNKEELLGIIAYYRKLPAVDGRFFPDTIVQHRYFPTVLIDYAQDWASESASKNAEKAWTVNFCCGSSSIEGKEATDYVRLIR